MSQEEETYLSREGLRLSKFFEVELSIRIFGHVIFHFIYPPKNK